MSENAQYTAALLAVIGNPIALRVFLLLNKWFYPGDDEELAALIALAED